MVLALWIGIAIIGSVAGYIGVRKYQTYRAEQAEQEKRYREEQAAAGQTAADREKQFQDQLAAQQKALEEAKQETENLKTEIQTARDQSSKKLSALEQKVAANNAAVQQEEQTAQTIDYARIPLQAVVRLDCVDKDPLHWIGGSGVIVDSKNRIVLTNAHVVFNDQNATCAVTMQKDEKNADIQANFFAEVIGIGSSSDFALLQMTKMINQPSGFVPIPDDYVFPEKTAGCTDQEVSLGDKLVVAGFPSVGGFTITLTEGIVSGFDGDYVKTSAKIEHGNSGGAAFLYNGCFLVLLC